MRQEELKNNVGGKTSVDKMAVREWLHANHRRLVKVKFGPEAAIHTVDRKGEKLRTVNFRTSEALTVEESQVGIYRVFIIYLRGFETLWRANKLS